MNFTTSQWIVFCVPFGLILLGLLAWFFLRHTIRTRLRMNGQLRRDPDIPEWMVIFNWSRKVLYGPTIVFSLLAALMMVLKESYGWGWTNEEYIVGGVWLTVFFFNFVIDEYEISIKVLLAIVLLVGTLFMWLAYLNWVEPFISLFAGLQMSMSAATYLVIALIMLMAIVISWVKGLFCYVSITPNYMNIQSGPTESGEQIDRQDFSTRIDTGDFLERLLGFGRLVITFRDSRRQPMVLLVSRIAKRALMLESIRGVIAVDRAKTDQSTDASSQAS